MAPPWRHRSYPSLGLEPSAAPCRQRLARRPGTASRQCPVHCRLALLSNGFPRFDWTRACCLLLAVFVVAAPPDTLFIAALGRAVEPLIHAPDSVQPTGIAGVGVVDLALFKHEGAETGPFANEGGYVGTGGGGGPGNRTFTTLQLPLLDGLASLWTRQRRLAQIVVDDDAFALLLLAEPDIEVTVEIAVERAGPVKAPAHALLEPLQLGQRCPRDGGKGDVMVLEMDNDAIKTIGDRRAGRAAGAVVRPEHEVIDKELRTALEQLQQ